MIPLTLVTGFLGSGKTTMLRRIASRPEARGVVFIVNEFGTSDVDGEILAGVAEQVVPIPGGSIFCRCLVTEFIGALSSIPTKFPQVAGVVIEASGIANPMVIEQMLAETKLDQTYSLRRVICVVDPATFPTLLKTLPNIHSQVEASDLVIINKIDLFPSEAIDEVEREVLRIHRDAEIRLAVRCDVDFDLFGERASRGLKGEYALCADPNYLRLSVPLPGETDLAHLRQAIEAIADAAHRIKGHVFADGAHHRVDFTHAGLTIERIDHAPLARELVLIVRGDSAKRSQEFVRMLKPLSIAAH